MTAEKQKEEHLALKNARMKMTNTLLKYILWAVSIFIILMIIGIAYGIWKNSPAQTQISAYPIRCEKTNADGSCADAVALPKLMFKVYANQSYVIMTANGKITELHSCTIIDLKNWQCNISNYDNLDYASGTPEQSYLATIEGINTLSLGFANGSFSMSAPTSSKLSTAINNAKMTFVSEQQWLSYPASNN